MIDIILQRKGLLYFPFSEEDATEGLVFQENRPLRAKITGARKARSYKELCCYFGSVRFIADHNFNEDMNTFSKVDYLTRIQCGFVEDTVFDPNTKRVHWIPKSLSYDNCDQPESHRFIACALEKHASLLGITDVNKYVKMLNEL